MRKVWRSKRSALDREPLYRIPQETLFSFDILGRHGCNAGVTEAAEDFNPLVGLSMPF